MKRPWEWDDRRTLAVELDKAHKLSLEEIAVRCGCCRRTLFTWRHAPEYAKVIDEHRRAEAARWKAEADRMRAEYMDEYRQQIDAKFRLFSAAQSSKIKRFRKMIATDSTPKKRGPMKPKARRDWTVPFLESLRSCGVVSHASRHAKIDRTTAYDRRRQDEAFALEWDRAIDGAAAVLECEVYRRAMEGSDALLMFMLKAIRPEKYRNDAGGIDPTAAAEAIREAHVRAVKFVPVPPQVVG